MNECMHDMPRPKLPQRQQRRAHPQRRRTRRAHPCRCQRPHPAWGRRDVRDERGPARAVDHVRRGRIGVLESRDVARVLGVRAHEALHAAGAARDGRVGEREAEWELVEVQVGGVCGLRSLNVTVCVRLCVHLARRLAQHAVCVQPC